MASSKQSPFIQNRTTLDGVLIVNEVVDYRKRYKNDRFLLKVDFEKAFDSIFLGLIELYS